MKTYNIKGDYTDHKWFVVDAEEQILGRFCSKVASILRGKHKPEFSPHRDTGDFVVIINADKVKVSGNKLQQKMYYHHTGFVGHLKSTSLRDMMQAKPDFVVHEAIRKMLPKGSLGRQMIKKLKVYAGPEHPHEAQAPAVLDLNSLR